MFDFDPLLVVTAFFATAPFRVASGLFKNIRNPSRKQAAIPEIQYTIFLTGDVVTTGSVSTASSSNCSTGSERWLLNRCMCRSKDCLPTAGAADFQSDCNTWTCIPL